MFKSLTCTLCCELKSSPSILIQYTVTNTMYPRTHHKRENHVFFVILSCHVSTELQAACWENSRSRSLCMSDARPLCLSVHVILMFVAAKSRNDALQCTSDCCWACPVNRQPENGLFVSNNHSSKCWVMVLTNSEMFEVTNAEVPSQVAPTCCLQQPFWLNLVCGSRGFSGTARPLDQNKINANGGLHVWIPMAASCQWSQNGSCQRSWNGSFRLSPLPLRESQVFEQLPANLLFHPTLLSKVNKINYHPNHIW